MERKAEEEKHAKEIEAPEENVGDGDAAPCSSALMCLGQLGWGAQIPDLQQLLRQVGEARFQQSFFQLQRDIPVGRGKAARMVGE